MPSGMVPIGRSNPLPIGNAVFVLNASAQSVGPAPVLSGPRSAFLRPDPKQPDTLGWREWMWSPDDRMLKSPSQGSLWPEAELVVPHWDEGDVVRGVSGIHAHLVPRHWKILATHYAEYVSVDNPLRVHGIVERFGKYVLGTEGWRAEWVVIKELVAPSTEIGLEIEKIYPDVIVHYPEEGDAPCESVKSSEWGKGNRSVSRPRPATFPQLPPSQSLSQAISPLANVNPLSANQHLQSHLANQIALSNQALQGRHANLQAQLFARVLQDQLDQQARRDQLNQAMGLPMPGAPAVPPPSKSPPNARSEAELKLGAIVFWGFVVLGILAIGRIFS